MIKFHKNIIFFYFLLGINSLFCLEKLSLLRTDQSYIEAYFSPPHIEKPYPLILLIQGSDKDSVLGNHVALEERFNAQGIALISIEKRGINAEGIDNQQFLEYDYFEYRLYDFATALVSLDQKILPNWNGELIILAGSEGGKIAPRLALQYPDHIRGIVLVGSGGGFPFSEELKFQIETAIYFMNPLYKICYKIRDLFLPHKIDDKYQKILEQPYSLELWYDKTFRWWSSYLNYDPLPEMLQIQVPVYMIHGALDPKIPIESADAVKAAFDEESKHNLTYVRYENMEHAIKGREDVYSPMIEWIKSNFQK